MDEETDTLFDTGFLLGILSGIAPLLFFVMLGLFIRKKCSVNMYKTHEYTNGENEDKSETTRL